jgi:hypothetical protein
MDGPLLSGKRAKEWNMVKKRLTVNKETLSVLREKHLKAINGGTETTDTVVTRYECPFDPP